MEWKKLNLDEKHPFNGYITQKNRLKSRNSFLCCTIEITLPKPHRVSIKMKKTTKLKIKYKKKTENKPPDAT